jgi:type II secretory pathway pseudopilin PulG
LLARLASRARGLRSEEEGSFLVETLVAAVLVAVVAVAMFSALDGASQVSGRTKARALSASLAQTDQERMRSMPVSMLSNLRQSQVKPVNGVNYNVDSRADWIADNSAATDCTSNGAAADYIRITTTVTSPTQPGLRPIVVQGIVTPAPGTFSANQGSLAVTVLDRNGAGVPNLTVTITGPVTASDVTDANGCAFFGYEPVGNYTVSTSRPGWVDVMGRPTASKGASIASQQVSTAQLLYDQAGSAVVSFKTDATDYGTPTNTTRTAIASKARFVRVAHSQMETPGIRDGVAPLGTNPWSDGSDQSAITADNLFPFTSAYGVYAGNCDPADPTKQSPAQAMGTVIVTPGGSKPVTVQVPAVNAHVTRGGVNSPLANANVKITATGSGCSGTWTYKTNAAGNLDFPGLPYGTYTVCADDGTRKFQLTGVLNKASTGTAVQQLPVPTTGTSSTC